MSIQGLTCVKEAKFIKVAGVQERVIKAYSFEELPEAAEAQP